MSSAEQLYRRVCAGRAPVGLLAALACAGLVASGCAASQNTAAPVAVASVSAPSVSPTESASTAATAAAAVTSAAPTSAAPTSAVAPPSVCATNTRAQFVLVSISAQAAWMCAGSVEVYQAPVTTGARGDETPTGTWHVQGKQTNRTLTLRNGQRYHVAYWIPFDDDYGFHDASWQTFAFGSPQYVTDGSHGCVHLADAAMAWLFGWAQVGATVTVQA